MGEVFPAAWSIGEREWGTEECLVLAKGKYILKKLFIKKGCKGGLQYHRLKDECGYILEGKLKILYDEGEGVLKEIVKESGDWFHFEPGLVHQEEAIEDCTILEASTPHGNDRVRVEEKYGIVGQFGMKSTSSHEIIEL